MAFASELSSDVEGCGFPKNEGTIEEPSVLDTIPLPSEAATGFATRASQVIVSVQVPADTAYRNLSNWKTLAYNAIEAADDWLYSNYAIDLQVATYDNWGATLTRSAKDLAREARNLWAKYSTDDYVIAFTGQDVDAAGYTWLGEPFSLIKYQGANDDKVTVQHEVLHGYGLGHCNNSCVLNGTQSAYSNFNRLCATHRGELSKVAYKYGTSGGN